MEEKKKFFQTKWFRTTIIIISILLAIALIGVIAATIYVNHLLGLMNGNSDDSLNATLSSEQLATATIDPDHDPNFTGPSIGHDEIPINTVPTSPKEELSSDGIINILLIGEDRRPGQGRQRSDSMILCSFNTKKNTITMISFLRDTYIPELPGYWPEKLNAAYAFGGAPTLNKTLESYFGAHVDANIAVQFEGFQAIIDMLGGVDIELTEAEVHHLNTTKFFDLVPGMNHLNGKEALAYSRIRKIDMDAMRAQRQRNVLTALINAYKNNNVRDMLRLTSDILASGYIQTDMSTSEVLNYVTQLFPMLSSATINSQQIPADGTYQSMTVGKITATKVCDFEANRKILQNILFQ